MTRSAGRRWLLGGLLACGAACNSSSGSVASTGPVRRIEASVRAQFPHDGLAFTEGLVVVDGELFESVGLTGKSAVRRVDLLTGELLGSTPLPVVQFGEGLAGVGDRLVQLTWKSEIGHIYDRATLAATDTFAYSGEGWGLTFDGTSLVMSDGTAELRFIDPDTFTERRRISVTAEGVAVDQLNELEFIDGLIYANVWLTPDIAVIDPATGNVRQWIDTTALRPASTLGDVDAVANGIAYDADADRLYVTGKRWPVLYEIERPPIDSG